MATITLQSPDGSTETFECDEDTFILDALEEAGLDPVSYTHLTLPTIYSV